MSSLIPGTGTPVPGTGTPVPGMILYGSILVFTVQLEKVVVELKLMLSYPSTVSSIRSKKI